MDLVHELAPELERAVGVDGGKVCERVVFHRLQCQFRRVYSVVVGFHELYLCFVGCDISFDGAGAFIVEDVECWLVAVRDQFLIN